MEQEKAREATNKQPPEEKLKTTKIQEKSCQEYITQNYLKRTKEMIITIETMLKSKAKE